MIKVSDLDKRMCDIDDSSDDTQTLREFIRGLEEKLGMCPEPIDLYGDLDLAEYINEIAEYYFDK